MSNGRLHEVAAAVADGEAVDWRDVGASSPGSRPTLRNLEVLARIAQSRRAEAGLSAPRVNPSSSLALSSWERMLLSIAGLRSLVAIFVGLAALPDRARDLYLAQLGFTASCLLAGLILLRSAPGDRRATTLSAILITSAGSTAWPHYARRFPAPGALAFDPLFVVMPEAFLAYWFWAFVAVFPRRVLGGSGDRLFHFGQTASFLWGSILLAAHAVMTVWPSTMPSLGWLARKGGAGFWGVVGLMLLLALAAMRLAARRADAGDRAKAGFFMGAVAAGFGPLFLIEVAASFTGSSEASSRQLALQLLPTLTVPFTTAWGILVRRILPARDLFHQAARHLVARASVGAAVGIPVAAAAVLLLTQRDRPVAEALGGFAGRGLALLTALLLPVALYRRPLLALVDRRFNRETQDWPAHLAALTRGLVGVDSLEAVGGILRQTVAEPLGAGSLEVLRLSADGRRLVPSKATHAPLSPDAGPALLAFDSDEPLEVDPALDGSAFWWFPESDRRWILDARAGLLLPLRSGDRPIGLLVLGPRRAERACDADEVQFLRAVGAVVASIVDRLADPPPPQLAPAVECECGGILDSRGCDCGGQSGPARLPRVLAGRYNLIARVGQGGMGRVYRAKDVELDRFVALKTLPLVSAEASIRLRQEARAMAGVSHPNLAVLYGIERHDSAPVLVAEFMSGGTLGDRISGPMPVDEAVRVGVAIASALEALHAASFIHHDVKPSNIGFSERDEPKLLDLGLADAAFRIRASPQTSTDVSLPSFAGTPRYAPPEAWVGAPVGAEGDLWALAMTLYECLAGRHPLSGVPFAEWLPTLRALPRISALRADGPPWLSDFLAAGVSAEPEHRWTAAVEVVRVLRERGSSVRD